MLLNCPSIHDWHTDVPRSAKGPIVFGLTVLLVWAVGFGYWAGFAPLDGAVVSTGSFVATGENKKIQHLEGGIIREILVREGDLIERGQAVLRLDDTAVKARLRRLTLRHYRLVAMRARLLVESKAKKIIILPDSFQKIMVHQDMKDILARQENELATRKEKLNAELLVLAKEISGLRETIKGYTAQVKATKVQIGFFSEDLKGKSSLVKRGLVRKTEVLDIRRAHARLIGEQGQLMGRIAESRQRMARADQQIAHLRFSAIQVAVEELRKTETEIDDVKEQIRAAKDIVTRIDVRAPVPGIVVKLHHHTKGGVISPGAIILELLPINNELIIEARITPGNITHVEQGQKAQVRLSALNQRLVPMIDAIVSYVSADAVLDRDMQNAPGQVAGQGVFVVRVKLDPDDIKQKAADFRPTPGMPVEVYIKTGERTFFSYLLRPILDSFARAFREQ